MNESDLIKSLEISTWRLDSNGLSPVLFDTPISSLDDISRLLPPAAYTTFRTYDAGRRVLGLTQHLNRLEHSAQLAGCSGAVQRDVLRAGLRQVMSSIAPQEGRLRVSLDITSPMNGMYISLQIFLPLPASVRRLGVSVQSCEAHRKDPELKLTPFISETQSLRSTQKEDIFELLLLDENQRILEGMTSNFFGVCNGVLVTAERNILAGVTRQSVLELARQAGIPIRFEAIALAEIATLDECFLTSSSRGIVPIVQVNGHTIGTGRPGILTIELGQRYEEIIQQQAEWI